MKLNNNSAVNVKSFIDLFFGSKIDLAYQQNVDVLLNLFVINDQQISLYNGYNSEYRTVINKNIILNENNWLAVTRVTKPIIRLTTPYKSVPQNSFLYPWGIVIVVVSGIFACVVFVFILVYRHKKQKRLASSKNHSTFNSRNGLLFTNSNLSSLSASSIFSGSPSNEDVNKLVSPNNQSRLSLLKERKSFKKTRSDSFINTKVSHLCNNHNELSYCDDCNNKAINNNNEPISNGNKLTGNKNQSFSSNNSSFIMSANEDQFNTTTTESVKTFGSNELNQRFICDTSKSTANNNNSILTNDLNEQFKQILNWTPTYDFFKDVFEDLSLFESNENKDISLYHETEQQRDMYKNSLKPKIVLNHDNLSEYNNFYEKDIYVENFIELPIDLNLLNQSLNSLSDNMQSFV